MKTGFYQWLKMQLHHHLPQSGVVQASFSLTGLPASLGKKKAALFQVQPFG